MEWTHLICVKCWNEQRPDKQVEKEEPNNPVEPCCFCEGTTTSGIYVRAHPAALRCKGVHWILCNECGEPEAPYDIVDGRCLACNDAYRFLINMERIYWMKNPFEYRKMDEDQTARSARIRAHALAFFEVMREVTPTGREQSLAFTKLEECVMWANKAIAGETHE